MGPCLQDLSHQWEETPDDLAIQQVITAVVI